MSRNNISLFSQYFIDPIAIGQKPGAFCPFSDETRALNEGFGCGRLSFELVSVGPPEQHEFGAETQR